MVMDDAAIGKAVIDPKTYVDQRAYDELFGALRRESPARWAAPEGYRPFWLVTRHADIIEIERQPARFVNEQRSVLTTIADEQRLKALTGRQDSALRTLVNMDDPDHRVFRAITQAWFMPPNLQKLEGSIAALAREFVDRMEAMGGACDFARDIANWYPLRVIMSILGVPPQDEALMLRLTQELLGSTDPEMKRQSGARRNTYKDFFDYFAEITADRRRHPRDDVASVIANATLDGRPIGELEAASYYVIIATAGHDTTSSTTAGGLLALLQHPDALARLRAEPNLLTAAVDEMVRWVSPVKHFFRTATEDFILRGQEIKAGDSLMMCYPSGNRDEDVFEAPFEFRIDRSPNRHLAFGFGAHLCLGMHLARIEIRAFFRELLPRLDHVELAGEPAWVEANFVSGLKRMPIRYGFTKAAA
jgi:cytochrome P450